MVVTTVMMQGLVVSSRGGDMNLLEIGLMVD